MDVYVDKKNKVWVMNLCPFNEQMNTALFSYDELSSLQEENKSVCFRVVEQEGNTPVSDQVFHQLPLEMQTLSDDKVEEYIRNLKTMTYYVCVINKRMRTSEHIIYFFSSLYLFWSWRTQMGY